MDKHIGAQYFTIRDHIQSIEEFEESCKKIAEIGYKIVQISGTPLAASQMRPILDEYGLKTVTTHRSFNDFLTKLDDVIDYNRTLGSDLCGVGMMPLEYAASLEGVKKFIAEANKICAVLKGEGLYFGYHNHAFEFTRVGERTVYDYLIEETDPETFNFIADTYWFQTGGKNPPEELARLGKRAMAVHFKDLTASAEEKKWGMPIMAEVGSGNLDWDKIISACEKAGTRWALVEQDICVGSPFDALKKSYDYLAEKGFC